MNEVEIRGGSSTLPHRLTVVVLVEITTPQLPQNESSLNERTFETILNTVFVGENILSSFPDHSHNALQLQPVYPMIIEGTRMN